MQDAAFSGTDLKSAAVVTFTLTSESMLNSPAVYGDSPPSTKLNLVEAYSFDLIQQYCKHNIIVSPLYSASCSQSTTAVCASGGCTS